MPLPHAFDVLVKQSLDDLLAKIAPLYCPRAEEQILGHLAEIKAKPLVQRNPESILERSTISRGTSSLTARLKIYFLALPRNFI